MRWTLAMVLLLVSACGFDPDPYHDLISSDAVYSYEFVEAGCSTGRRAFLDKRRFCQALTDEALNGRCASGQRLSLLAEYC